MPWLGCPTQGGACTQAAGISAQVRLYGDSGEMNGSWLCNRDSGRCRPWLSSWKVGWDLQGWWGETGKLGGFGGGGVLTDACVMFWAVNRGIFSSGLQQRQAFCGWRHAGSVAGPALVNMSWRCCQCAFSS